MAETDNSNSTTITGRGRNKFCLKGRGWLCYRVYDYPENEVPPHMCQYVFDKKNWQQIEESKDNSIDYLARYYEPKDGPCEPTVAYRGTSSEFVDLGFFLNLEINGQSIFPNGPLRKFDQNMMEDRAYYKIDILNESGEFNLPVINAGWYNDYPITYRIHAVLGAKDGKGWAVNVLQAFGQRTQHYEEAKNFGVDIAGSIAEQEDLKSSEKTLYFTGHSLGGGLASAAAHAAKIDYPNLKIFGTTFNASGLHQNTVPDIKIGSVPFSTHAVEHKVLTTPQSHSINITWYSAGGRCVAKIQQKLSMLPFNLIQYIATCASRTRESHSVTFT